MSPATFKVSLRIRHPNLPTQTITDELSLSPGVSWETGDRKQTPKGTLLEGFRAESYWFCQLQEDDLENLPKSLLKILKKLSQHKVFFEKIQNGNGTLEVLVGVFGAGNFVITLEPQLIKAAALLGIEFSFDIYAQKI